MFLEQNENPYFQDGTQTAAEGKMKKADDYTNTIAKPTYRTDIDFGAESSTSAAGENRSFITQIMPSGSMPVVSPKK